MHSSMRGNRLLYALPNEPPTLGSARDLHARALCICASLTQSLRTFWRKRSVRSNTGGNRIRS